jgi:hypothetical protein
MDVGAAGRRAERAHAPYKLKALERLVAPAALLALGRVGRVLGMLRIGAHARDRARAHSNRLSPVSAVRISAGVGAENF